MVHGLRFRLSGLGCRAWGCRKEGLRVKELRF